MRPLIPIPLDSCWPVEGSSPLTMRMPRALQVLAVVPTYNEAENIGLLIDQVLAAAGGLHETTRSTGPRWGAELAAEVQVNVLVVDDASPDGTGDLVRAHPDFGGRVFLQSRSAKLGLGSAYRSGIAWGLERGYGALVQIDADGSHAPDRIPELIAVLADHDLAIGSRYVPGGTSPGWPWSRRLISPAANRYARTVLRVPVRDVTAGFRAWRASALLRAGVLETTSEGYCFQIETSWRAHRAGLRTTEIPISFTDRVRGKSKMSSTIALEALRCILRWRIVELAQRVRTGGSRLPATPGSPRCLDGTFPVGEAAHPATISRPRHL